ncbi:hypothetical protein J6Z39_09110 [bacterium]|nr:hypothetical protein [bacterium]MBP5435962.1 hypothetical protein [bacterium]
MLTINLKKSEYELIKTGKKHSIVVPNSFYWRRKLLDKVYEVDGEGKFALGIKCGRDELKGHIIDIGRAGSWLITGIVIFFKVDDFGENKTQTANPARDRANIQ